MSPLTSEQIDRFIELSHDPKLVDMMGWKPFNATEPGEKQRFIDQMEAVSVPGLKSRNTITFSLIARDTEEPFGYASLKGIDTTKSHAEVAIAIMKKEYRGQGYGTEAMKLVLTHAFNTMGLARVYLTVFTHNRGAVHVYEKMGFRTTEVLEKSWKLSSGEYVDMLVMELKRDEALFLRSP